MTLARAMQDPGHRLIEPGIRGMPKADELAFDTVRLQAQFPAANCATRQKLSRLETRVAAFLPATRCAQIDLETARTLTEMTIPLDPVMAVWCKAGQDRWLSVSQQNRAGPWIGLRPAVG